MVRRFAREKCKVVATDILGDKLNDFVKELKKSGHQVIGVKADITNLDEAEKLVQEALKRLIKGRTTFIIAHRLSTISHADKIFVIKKGKIVEKGNHQKLMKIKNGIYRNFYLMQSVFKEDLLDGKKV